MIAHSSPAEHAAILLLGAGAFAVYGAGWMRWPHASSWRLAAWAGALVSTLVATMPAAERWAEESFTGHMAQHLLMIVVAAPLFVVARPVRTVRHLPCFALRPARSERALARWWHRFGAVAAPLLFLGVLYLTHLTHIYEWALDNRLVHDLEHIAYLAASIALWSVVLGAGRGVMATTDASTGVTRISGGAARVGTAMGVIAGMAILGVVLTSATEPLVPTYVEQLGYGEALDDQRLAASFMWAGGMALTLPLLLASVWFWASAEERIVTRREALTDRPRHPV